MGCGCNEQHNSNCFCQCENLEIPQGPTGLQGIQGATGAAGAAGAAGADGADAFNAQLSSYAVAINLADTTGAFAGVPPVAYKYYNNTITTVFSLTEGGVPVAIDVANMALTYGGEVNLATIANVAGGIKLTLVRGLNTPTSNYGYVDMTYTHGALTFVKRFNVVYVHDGDTFLVGEDDPTAVTDPIEGNTLVTKAGQFMKYQGGAWVQILDIHQTTTKSVILTGALYTLNLTSTDERIISLTGSGTVNNNIAINLPVAGCTSGTEFKVLYNASMTEGTGVITVFGVVIPATLYGESFNISATYDGTTWVVNTAISEAMFKTFGNLCFSITPTPGSSSITYNVIDTKSAEVTYMIDPPLSTDNDIVFYLGDLITNLSSLYTRKIHFIVKNKITTDRFTATPRVVRFTYRRNGSALIIGIPQTIYNANTPYDNLNVRNYLEKSSGTITPTTAAFQTIEFYKMTSVVIDYTKLASADYKDYMAILHQEKVLWMYDGAIVTDVTEVYYI
jgi:hypothetical protein